jgi:phage terminase small subunit
MGLPKTLTEMQMKFAYELVSNEGRKTKTECAIDAGYSKDAARVMASKLTSPKTYPLVVKYIGELREEYQKNMRSLLKTISQSWQNYVMKQEKQKHGVLLLTRKWLVEKPQDFTSNKK